MRLPVKLIVLAVCAIAGFGGLMLVADSGLSALSDSLLAQQEDAVIGTRALDLERSCLNVAARLSETIALGVSEGGSGRALEAIKGLGKALDDVEVILLGGAGDIDYDRAGQAAKEWQLFREEGADAGIRESDGIDQSLRGFDETGRLVAFAGLECHGLRVEGSQPFQVDQLAVFLAVAESSRGDADRIGQDERSYEYPKVGLHPYSFHRMSPPANTGPSAQARR